MKRTITVCDLCKGEVRVSSAAGIDLCDTCLDCCTARALFDLLQKREKAAQIAEKDREKAYGLTTARANTRSDPGF